MYVCMYVYVLYMIYGLYASVMKYTFNRNTFYTLSMRVLLFTSLKMKLISLAISLLTFLLMLQC